MKKKPNKKDKDYMTILDQPIEELKKPMGQSVDFDKAMAVVLNHKEPKKGKK